MASSKRVNIVSINMVKHSSFLYEKRSVTSPNDAAGLFQYYMGTPDRENFVVLCLNTKNEPTNIHTAHIGSINASFAHPREILKTAILSNSSSIIVCHNHPSGTLTPSDEDIDFTHNLRDACDIMGINLTDHIILGHNGDFLSFKEERIF